MTDEKVTPTNNIVIPETLSQMQQRLIAEEIAAETAKEAEVEKCKKELTDRRNQIRNLVSKQQMFIEQQQSGQQTKQQLAEQKAFEREYVDVNSMLRQKIYDAQGVKVDEDVDLVKLQAQVDELCESQNITGPYSSIEGYRIVYSTNVPKNSLNEADMNYVGSMGTRNVVPFKVLMKDNKNANLKAHASDIPSDIKAIMRMVRRLSGGKVTFRLAPLSVIDACNKFFNSYYNRESASYDKVLKTYTDELASYDEKIATLTTPSSDPGRDAIRIVELKRIQGLRDSIAEKLENLRYHATIKTNESSKIAQLSQFTVSFKGEGSSKNTRVLISIASQEDFAATGDVIFFAQESRDRFMVRIARKNFSTQNDFNLFIANSIIDFFQVGIKITENRLMMEKTGNTGLAVIAEIINKTRRYNVEITRYKERVNSLKITTKGRDNQWLYISITESELLSTYNIDLYNKADASWSKQFKRKQGAITIDWMVKNITTLLDKWFATNYNADTKEKENHDLYILSKFNYVKMYDAVASILLQRDDYPQYGIFIKDALSKNDSRVEVPQAYKAEIVVGKTNQVEFFILAFQGVYFPHLRNRIFVFDVEYKINGSNEVQKAVFTTFDELREATGLFDGNVKTINLPNERIIATTTKES